MKSIINQIKNRQSGFTIVELLVVIVVIGILASITIVAYNGVTNRAKTVKEQSAASVVQKKAELVNGFTSAYPSAVVATTGFSTALPADASTSLQGSGIRFAAISTAPANENTVEYFACTSPAGGGARVGYWDYAQSTKVQVTIGTCTTYSTTALTGGPY